MGGHECHPVAALELVRRALQGESIQDNIGARMVDCDSQHEEKYERHNDEGEAGVLQAAPKANFGGCDALLAVDFLLVCNGYGIMFSVTSLSDVSRFHCLTYILMDDLRGG